MNNSLEQQISERNIEVFQKDSFGDVLSKCMELRKEKYWSFRGQRYHKWFAEPHLGDMTTADLERNIAELEQETEDLSVKISTYSSMQSIRERMEGMNFVQAQNIQYHELDDGAVAMS